MTHEALVELLRSLSLEEKVGQLCQIDMSTFLDDAGSPTGPMAQFHLTEEQILTAGSLICGGNADAAEFARVQEIIREKAPHPIPPLIMSDVIHGMRTIFPIPLALGCTFDVSQAETMARISAAEAAASGIHVTFAPMADVVRDPRWGRCMESVGESSALCGEMSAAMVRGFRGKGLKAKDTVATCVKHFAAYGLVQAGRDYAPVDVSHTEMYNVYLPPFKQALDAGCDMLMPAFTPIDRKPAIVNHWLLQSVLRDRWQWKGAVISDWGAPGELIPHGLADDLKEAAHLTFDAGMDMDMMSGAYLTSLKELVEEGTVSMDALDACVMRILTLKNALGLFEKPCKCITREEQEAVCHKPAHRKAALKAALRSCVLLRNEGVLPLHRGVKVALTGDHADNHGLLGGWSAGGRDDETPSLMDAFSADKHVTLTTPEDADVILYAVGEDQEDTGEARSRQYPTLSAKQVAELERLHGLGKPVVMLLFCGRPMILTDVLPLCDAILCAWFPGSEGAEAVRRLVMGVCSPSGHLSMTFPRSIGQIPIHHDVLSTGRPDLKDGNPFVSRYIDGELAPLYPFGYGLSYTTFRVGKVRVASSALSAGEELPVSVKVLNSGDRAAETVVQLYFRGRHGGYLRPVRTLCAWQRVHLAAGESTMVHFSVPRSAFDTMDGDGAVVPAAGWYDLAAGEDSTANFTERVLLQ